ncbi:hypothetical protein ACTQ1N_12380 [Porcincola sp. LCP21S3_C12]|jgi:hypothetical protein|uniref:hypothetical protein n=1 Tax=Porcincola sp. LCP21S3_C12 TaxID=3438798 RepID=UPI003F9734B1
MHDLEYLTEKDLEYFKKKQDDGDPVRIIYLSPEVLDSLSFEDIDRMEQEAKEKTGSQPTEEELEEWLKKHNAIQEPEKEEKTDEGQQPDDSGIGREVRNCR